MTAFPKIKVELYTTSWINISSSVRANPGLSVRRGRATRFDTSGPGTCSFTVDNYTGNFTPGNTAGAYNGYIVKNAQIRVTDTGNSVQLFQGFVDSWSASGSNSDYVTVVNCSDRLKFLSQNPLNAYGVERAKTIVYNSGTTPGVVYPLASNPGGTTSSQYQAWRDTSAGNLTWASTSDGTYQWTTEAPPFCSGSVKLAPSTSTQIGRGLSTPRTWDPGAGGAVFGWFRTSDNSYRQNIYNLYRSSGTNVGRLDVWMDTNGAIHLEIVSDGASPTTVSIYSGQGYNDDTWHSFGVTVNSTGKIVNLYVDGLSRANSTVGSALTIANTNRVSRFGSRFGLDYGTAITAGSYGFRGYLSTVAVNSITPGSTDASDFHNAGQWGDGSDPINTRLSNILKFVYPTGTPSITSADYSSVALSAQDSNGKDVLAMFNDVADTERGLVYVDNLGQIQFRGNLARKTTYNSNSPIAVLDAFKDLSGDQTITIIDDDANFANRVVATSAAGTYSAEDSTSITALGVISEAWNCLGWAYSDITTVATNRLNSRSITQPRIGQITVDLLTLIGASASTLLGLDPLDMISFTNLPSRLVSSQPKTIVEGYTIVVTDGSYLMTLDLSPQDDF